MENEGYDVIIIGAGPAGLTSALYAVRDGLKTLLISRTLGGTANSIVNLETWPGYKGTGVALMKSFYEQLKSYPIEVVLADVQTIEKKGKKFFVKTNEKEFETKTLILATGIKRSGKIPGEEKFRGRGVSYCATCDAFFYKNKTTAIIVEEDSKTEEIMTLANLSEKVYVLCNKKFKFEKELKKFGDKVEMINNAGIKEIRGNKKAESLVIEGREIKVDGIFIEQEASPLTEFAKKLKLKLDKNNYIVIDDTMKTSVDGIFAAGDITNSKVKQVLTASAQGAVAAKNASNWLKR